MNNPSKWLIKNTNLRFQVIFTVVASFLGKALGFIRIQQIALNIGTTELSDVMFIILQLIWLIESVVVAGAIAPMLISKIFQIDFSEGWKKSTKFFLNNFAICLIISILFGLFIIFSSEMLVNNLFFDSSIEEKQFYISLFYVVSFFPLILTIIHFLSLINRLLDNGVWYSVNQIVVNTSAILGLLIGINLGDAKLGATFMMIAITFGGFLMCFIQYFAAPAKARGLLIRTLLRSKANIFLFNPPFNYWKGAWALVIVTLLNEVLVYIDFYFANNLGPGNISAIGYSSRIPNLINMIFVSTVFVVLEPRWAKSLSNKPKEIWSKIISNDMISIVSFILAPFAITLLFTNEVTEIIYRTNFYSFEDRLRINELTQIFSFLIIALCLQTISLRAIVITGHQEKLMYVGITLILLKIFLNILLISFFEINGLAIATVMTIFFGAILNFSILIYYKSGLSIKLKDILKLLINAAIILIICMTFDYFLSPSYLALFIICICVFAMNITCGHVLGIKYVKYFFNTKNYY
tara:strand:+ start:1670 stop:3238 length:1569 start_codon:yes stop_codon:yes gene_type:complete